MSNVCEKHQLIHYGQGMWQKDDDNDNIKEEDKEYLDILNELLIDGVQNTK